MRLRTIAASTLIVVAAASLAVACSVPVFRYALEHWHPDSYVVFVFCNGDLTKDQQAVVDLMQPKSANGNPAANVLVKVIDVSKDTDPVTQQIRQNHPSEQLPWMVLQSPPKWGPPQTVWQGELNGGNAAILLDSPARAQVSRKLIEGESVVWVLLECGRKDEDDSAFNMLTTELRTLETKIKLPEIEAADLGDLSVAPHALKVAFSAIRVSRDDVAEQALVEMLLRVESDLLEEPQVSQPMAFPVFGRGRALYALVGKGIAPDVIEDACQFLAGACQCTVKAQNPGVDLIMNVDWDKMVIPTEAPDKDLPPLAGFSGFVPSDDGLAGQDGANKVADGIQEAKDVLLAQAENGEISPDAGSREAVNPAFESTMSASQDSHDHVTPSGTSDADTTHAAGNHTPAAGMQTNVIFVLVFLVVGAVMATLFFLPRTN